MGQTEPHFLPDPMSDRKKKFSPTRRNIYKKTAWCMTLHGENAVNFLCTPNEELEDTLHPQKFGCTPKNEGKGYMCPQMKKPVGMLLQ